MFEKILEAIKGKEKTLVIIAVIAVIIIFLLARKGNINTGSA